MSKMKVILSIVLLLLLIGIGIVLPFLWKQEKQKQADTEKPVVSKVETEKETEAAELNFAGFDKLEDFFSASQIEDLKLQFPSYLEETRQSSITKVTFLPNKTAYPDRDTTHLTFTLSDGTTLPIFYSASLGTFLFGEEKLQINSETRTYERQTDNTLPSVTTEEIEARQEGGYADTKEEVQP